MTPVPRSDYRIGLPDLGNSANGETWEEILNSDAGMYGGSNLGNSGKVIAACASRTRSRAVARTDIATVVYRNLQKERESLDGLRCS
jgi:1,4-alpha-glucan branching enzyme